MSSRNGHAQPMEERIDSTIRHAYRRMKGGYEAVTYHSPLSSLLEKEPLPDVGAMTEEQLLEEAAHQNLSVPETAGRLEIIELLKDAREANWEQRVKGMKGMLRYAFADGPHPLDVLKRIYAVAKAVDMELVLNMSCEELAILSGDDGRATVSARVKRLYNDLVEGAGMKGSFAPFQKDASAVATYRDVQRGNQNRRGKKFIERFGRAGQADSKNRKLREAA